MQYALVNGEKREASRGLIGFCQGCDAPMIPKCGPIKVPHWAHKTKQCDSFWEPEKPWHRDWKELFPSNWREVRRHDANGECHIADIHTEHGLTIEFQHSSISSVEIAAREKFYQSVGTMVWVVDGSRYKKIETKLLKDQSTWRTTPVSNFFRVAFLEEYFPRSWINCAVPVFFDFDDVVGEKTKPLLCLLPYRAEGWAVFALVNRVQFIEFARTKSELINHRNIIGITAEYIRLLREAEHRRNQPIPAWRLAAGRSRRRF